MKTAYQSITLRYVHDVVTVEFVNVGVVVYAPGARFLKARFSACSDRITAMFNEIDELHFREVIGHLTRAFEDLSKSERLHARTVGDLVRSVLPADESSLQWSHEAGGLSENLTETVNYLFHRLVGRYARQLSM